MIPKTVQNRGFAEMSQHLQAAATAARAWHSGLESQNSELRLHNANLVYDNESLYNSHQQSKDAHLQAKELLEQSKAEANKLREKLVAQRKRTLHFETCYKKLLQNHVDFHFMSETERSASVEHSVDTYASAMCSHTSAIGSASKSSVFPSKKRKLSELRSTDELQPAKVVSATALQQLKAIVTLGHEPYWKLLEDDWRSYAALFTGGLPFLSPGCVRLIQQSSHLDLKRILDPKKPVVKITNATLTQAETIKCGKQIQKFIAKYGLSNQNPEGIDDSVVVVEEIKDESKTHTNALKGQKGVFAKMDLAKFQVLGEYPGVDLLKDEYTAVFINTRAETIHGEYAITKHIGGLKDEERGDEKEDVSEDSAEESEDENESATDSEDMSVEVVTDALAFCEQITGFGDLFPNCHTFASGGINVCAIVNDCREDINLPQCTATDEKRRNCEYVHAEVNGWTRVFLVCTKKIKENSQLLADYGAAYTKRDLAVAERRRKVNTATWQQLID